MFDYGAFNPGWFPHAQQLEMLYMRACGVDSVQRGDFKDMSSLVSLDLSDNRLERIGPGVLTGLSSLQHIRLGEQRGIGVAGLKLAGAFDNTLSKLRSIGLQQVTDLRGVFDNASVVLSNVVCLTLVDLRVDSSRIVGMNFSSLPNLVTLEIYGTTLNESDREKWGLPSGTKIHRRSPYAKKDRPNC